MLAAALAQFSLAMPGRAEAYLPVLRMAGFALQAFSLPVSLHLL